MIIVVEMAGGGSVAGWLLSRPVSNGSVLVVEVVGCR